MYKLTLNRSERAAFIWIGHRYAHGDEMLGFISRCAPPDANFDGDNEITFEIPEHIAWEIKGLIEDDGRDPYPWDCFAPALRCKMQEFIDSII
jgi:hypothetical protein